MEKTTTITSCETYSYAMMSFGLKNARATYQRTVATLLYDSMHREIVVYVDNVVIKANERDGHVLTL